MKLFRVRTDKFLHWPPEVDKKDKNWLGPGGVVDLADPFVAKCVEGQEYKLEPVEDPKRTEPTPIVHQRFKNLRTEFLNAGKKAEPERATAPEPEGSKDIPTPDVRPTGSGKEKRHGPTGSGPVSPSDPG